MLSGICESEIQTWRKNFHIEYCGQRRKFYETHSEAAAVIVHLLPRLKHVIKPFSMHTICDKSPLLLRDTATQKWFYSTPFSSVFHIALEIDRFKILFSLWAILLLLLFAFIWVSNVSWNRKMAIVVFYLGRSNHLLHSRRTVCREICRRETEFRCTEREESAAQIISIIFC
jgi:hypothetical protein